MTRSTAIVIGIIILFGLSLIGTYYLYQKRQAEEPNIQEASSTLPNSTPQNFPTVIASPSPVSTTPTPGQVTTSQPATGIDDIKNIGITVSEPKAGAKINSSVKIKGMANVYEGNVVIKVKDGNGQILGQTNATACMGVDACPFETTVFFPKPTTTTGTVELYSPSGRDGSELYLQTIPVEFN